MSEYRHNILTDQWVIIASERGKRPHDFVHQQNHPIEEFDSKCPFCVGHEQCTPPEVYAVRPSDIQPDRPGWQCRVVPNKFPALSPEPQTLTETPFDSLPGLGTHEVIIESPRHSHHFARHSSEHAQLVLKTLCCRYQLHESNPQTHQIAVFYNHGATSGASLVHPHFQFITLSMTPPRTRDQMKYCAQYHAKHRQSPFAKLLDIEHKTQKRIIASTSRFTALCPYASMVPFEVNIICHDEIAHLSQLYDIHRVELAQLLQQVLKPLDQELGDADYNLAFRTAPATDTNTEGFRLYLQIYPRLSTMGGFELATGIFINTVTPETAAEFYCTGSALG